VITLTIPEATPSANVTLWAHWAVKARLRKKWAWLVRVAKLNAQIAPESLLGASVRIDRYGKRQLDHDNFVAGCKSLVDSLVAEKLIAGDNPDQVTITYLQHKGSPGHTVVTIMKNRAAPSGDESDGCGITAAAGR